MNRRSFFGKAAAAGVAAPALGGDIARQLSLGRGMDAAKLSQAYAGESEGLRPSGPSDAMQAFQTAQDAHDRTLQIRGLHRGLGFEALFGIHPLYHDILELRSISPAAKRYIIAERALREAREAIGWYERLTKGLGLPPDMGYYFPRWIRELGK